MVGFIKKNYVYIWMTFIILIALYKIGTINDSMTTHILVYRFLNALIFILWVNLYLLMLTLAIRSFRSRTKTIAAAKFDPVLLKQKKNVVNIISKK